jgi:hypothetical protein
MRDAESVTLTERDIEAKGMTFHRPPPIMWFNIIARGDFLK